jgi:hypothetical protein
VCVCTVCEVDGNERKIHAAMKDGSKKIPSMRSL